ncbi:MAG: aspartate--tRNA(Asn) ligase [Patescibacteria group bacterium]
MKIKRTLTNELTSEIGKTVHLKGWLHKKRVMGGLAFILLRDRRGLAQILVDSSSELEKIADIQVSSVIDVVGEVVSEPRAPNKIEIHKPTINIITKVDNTLPIEIDKPLSHRSQNLETLFENKVLAVRNINERLIFRLRSELCRYIRQFLFANDFVEIQTPKILAGATEGGAEVFSVKYFEREAVLAQSPQFYKQIMVGAFERVFEIGPTFRAEPSMTSRHMSEITMLDIEMGFIEEHDDILRITQEMLFSVLTLLYKEHKSALEDLKSPPLVIKPDFPRYTVDQIHEMYTKSSGENTIGEKDLRPDEERFICEYAKENDRCEAVFVTEFPVDSMKFYHMINPEKPNKVLWADLLFRGLEIATCPMREHRYETLIKQMEKAGLDPKHPGYKYYLQAFEYGMPPHGGFGFGIDRLVAKTLGLSNVKEATLFPRDMNRLTP